MRVDSGPLLVDPLTFHALPRVGAKGVHLSGSRHGVSVAVGRILTRAHGPGPGMDALPREELAGAPVPVEPAHGVEERALEYLPRRAEEVAPVVREYPAEVEVPRVPDAEHPEPVQGTPATPASAREGEILEPEGCVHQEDTEVHPGSLGTARLS